jgi:hypothetical protein
VSRKIDFAGRDWSAHAQDHWLDFAGNPNFPDYLRLTFVAYGRHAANGHAKLERQELAQYLVRKDGTLPDRRNLWNSIQKAIRLGYLLPESQALCLVVSSAHVQGGKGDPNVPCRRDHTKRDQTNVVTDQRRSFPNVVTEAGRSQTNVVTHLRRSTPEPSLSSTNHPQATGDLNR